ncbi:glutathione S-transferase TAU 10 [Actinidia rufa]|uniref:Glutathione S-transferase n=1 Tax=Actinidia rufa TaxID=165716 RepID=A0A7J0GUE6_9ERIC|nr:glutathione S-transferase TAU 10 [Actinidia rufa]
MEKQGRLENKSEWLLQHNPIHKKVPVLVHKRKPIAKSLVILEYIDEFWNKNPKLLPEDPCERAKVRFCANFYDQKLLPSIFPIVKSSGKEQGKAIVEFLELLKLFQDGLVRYFAGKFSLFNGDNPGYLGIMVGANSCNYETFHKAVTVEVDQEKHCPSISWVAALKDHPLMKENISAHDKVVAKMRECFQSPQV